MEKDFFMILKNLLHRVRGFFSQHLTLMVLPSNSFKQLQFKCTFSFALFLLLLWTGLTSWAVLTVVGNVDYWSMRLSHEALKLKVQYFTSELRKSRELMDQVRDADTQLRKLLKMGNRKNIIEEKEDTDGSGGPSPLERSLLLKTLQKRLWDVSEFEIKEESDFLQRDSNLELQSFKQISQYIAYQRGKYRAIPKGWPTTGRITSKFGYRSSPVTSLQEFHTGLDIANERGTPVQATAEGIVQHAGWESGYGWMIVLNHGFGYNTVYGHNSVLLVNVGDYVKRGQVIAMMGSSGSSTGNHTHYEVWFNGQYQNPWKYIYSNTIEKSKRVRRVSRHHHELVKKV